MQLIQDRDLWLAFCEKCIEHGGFHNMESVSVSAELLDLCKGFCSMQLLKNVALFSEL